MWPFSTSVQPGDIIILSDGEEGTVKREASGNRVVVERIGNLSKVPIEIVIDRSKVRKKR